ncbi:hypothetical protein G7054_g9017 [Neopestalotiopsis clavispora]|nr:hypothetical protein G7054_g9017 [Neopestalotiopsis clavispora]
MVITETETSNINFISQNQPDSPAGSPLASPYIFDGSHEQPKISVTLPEGLVLSTADQRYFDDIQESLKRVNLMQEKASREMIMNLCDNHSRTIEHHPTNSPHNLQSELWYDFKDAVDEAYNQATYLPYAITKRPKAKEQQPSNSTKEEQPSNSTKEEQPSNSTKEEQPSNLTKEEQPSNSTNGSLRKRFAPAILYVLKEILAALLFLVLLMIDVCGNNTQQSLITLSFEIMFSAAYGGIHLAAWSSIFPTSSEQIIWRVACLVIMSSVPALFLLLVCGTAAGHATKRLTTKKTRSAPIAKFIKTSAWVFVTATILATVLLVVSSRCFVFVESFISLRTAPIGVYWTPAWIEMLPHL